MKRRTPPLLIACALSALGAGAGSEPPGPEAPRVFLLDAKTLLDARARLAHGEVGLQPALIRLRKDADLALALRPGSVMDKVLTAESGDKHDYFSYGPYWWPDPSKPKGLPYIRRDGEVNPDSDTGTDHTALSRLCDSVATLGLAYWFTGEERYAEKAALLTRVWFLDSATRMNPNFQHAQAIPGVTPGRGIGLIESRRLTDLNEGLALLGGSPRWTAADRQAFRVWLDRFYQWLTTSSNGRDEQKAANNHGTWYDVQTAHLALVLGRDDDARVILSRGLTLRLAAQVEPDGSQPKELERTKSLSYSLFNLEALFACARLGGHVGVDWWTFKTPDGRSLQQALTYLAPFADPSRVWPKKDVQEADRTRLLPLLAHSQQHRDDPRLRALLLKHSPADESGRWHLLLPAEIVSGGSSK